MATSSHDPHTTRDFMRSRRSASKEPDEEPLSELLRRFAQDAGALVRHEIALAKLEVRETVDQYVRGAVGFGAAAGVALFGALALLAFAILGLGALLDNYWLSALLVAVGLLGGAGILARAALKKVRSASLAPEETVAALEEDKRWVKQEVRELKQTLKS